MSGKGKRGFSLVEVMVVVSTVSAVMAVTIPAMNTARSRARAIVCRSNLGQLVLANIGYSNDHDGYYVPAAEDLWDPVASLQGGVRRWHGRRTGPDKPFDPMKGPLACYLADGKVKKCPERVEFTQSQDGSINFERGCGGYGYNMQYLGSRLWQSGITTMSAQRKAYSTTTNAMEVKRPAETLMFVDSALYGDNYLIEYSFAETPYYVVEGRVDVTGMMMGYPWPSIHFRHYGSANVGWADGHVEAKSMAKPVLRENYTAEMAEMNIGWFAPVDNTLFDLE